MFPQLSREEWQGVERHVVGKTWECAAWGADGQAADGLGGKPGRGLPFLDGCLPDALWWLKNKTEGWGECLGSHKSSPKEVLQDRCTIKNNPQIPSDPCLVHLWSTTAAELIGFTLVYVRTSTGSAVLPIYSIAAPAVRTLLLQIRKASIFARCQSTTHQFSQIPHRTVGVRQEVWHQNNTRASS